MTPPTALADQGIQHRAAQRAPAKVPGQAVLGSATSRPTLTSASATATTPAQPTGGSGPGDGSPAAGAQGTALVLAAMLLVALNLRVVITSLGPLLSEVRAGLPLSGLQAGVVTTLPALAFAAVGAATPWLVRRFSPPRLLVASMAVLAVGQLLRVTTSAAWLFVLLSGTALAGIAVANVLLPMLVRQYFPQRIGLVTGAYTMSLTVGASVAAAATVPIAHAAGSWRIGLGFWAVLAAAAAAIWLPIAWRARQATRSGRGPAPGRHRAVRVDNWPSTRQANAGSTRRDQHDAGSTRRDQHDAGSTGPMPVRAVVKASRTRLGWLMAAFFGAQSFAAYAQMGWLAQVFRDAGFSPESAGLLLAGVTAVSVPIALVMPTLATRLTSLRPLVLGTALASALSYAGLLWLPHEGALAWMVLLALGQGTFPMALAMIGLRARTSAGIVSLSAFTQSVGYLIAALGPLSIGLLYEMTGGWVMPIALLLVALLVQTGTGWAIARPRWIEDEADHPRRR